MNNKLNFKWIKPHYQALVRVEQKFIELIFTLINCTAVFFTPVHCTLVTKKIYYVVPGAIFCALGV